MEQPYDCCPVLTEFVLLDNVVSHLGAPRDILAASHVSQLWRTVMLRRIAKNYGQSKWPHFTHQLGPPPPADAVDEGAPEVGDGDDPAAAIGPGVVAAVKRWVTSCGIIPQVCVIFVAEPDEMESADLESFTAELKTVLPPNTAFWGSAAEGILSGSGEFVGQDNPAITLMLIPRSDAFRVSPVNLTTKPTKELLAAMMNTADGDDIVHAKIIVGTSTYDWTDTLVRHFNTRCDVDVDVSVSGGITGSELESPLLLKDGTPFAGVTILLFSKPAQSSFCAAGLGLQGGQTLFNAPAAMRDATLQTCYANFVLSHADRGLANVAGAISVSCVGRIGLEENKALAKQLGGAAVVGIFGQGELGNVSSRYTLDDQRFTDTEEVNPAQDVQWHGYTNFCHFFGDDGHPGEASRSASAARASAVA